MIKVENLSKTYNKNRKNQCEALKNVSFELDNKGMVFIIGKSGSGKSTLLNILGCLDIKTFGNIIFNNQNISDFSSKQLEDYRNNNIGFIFQDYCLLESMTVYENIELSLSLQNKVDRDLILKIIKDIGLEDKCNTPVNLLSGGQKQRVAIGRALVKSPSVILADEPTGNLDSKTTNQIYSILKDLSKTKLVIVVSHNLEDANKYANRIIELKDGKIVSDVDNFYIDKENIAILNPETNISDDSLRTL